MEDEPLQYQAEGAQARLTLNRPKARNALSAALIHALFEGLGRAEADPAVRVVVLTGAGEQVFCAGGDLSSAVGEGGFLAGHDGRRRYGELLLRLQSLSKPTVARVNGHALAGGLGLVLACDLAVAADTAELGTPEVDRGLFPMQVIALLQRHLGRKRALELVLTGARLKAQEALAWGLLSRVCPAADLDAVVNGLAAALSAKSSAVLSLGRRAFFAAEGLPLPSAMEHLASQLSLNVLMEDAREGVTSFLEKRAPQWKDK